MKGNTRISRESIVSLSLSKTDRENLQQSIVSLSLSKTDCEGLWVCRFDTYRVHRVDEDH
jgi:hypothetical protein